MSSSQELQQILGLSEEMKRKAQEGDWESLAGIQQSRQRLIDTCFPLDQSVESLEQARASIERILKLDREIMELAETQQRALKAAVGKLGQGKQADRAYRQAAKG